MSVHPLDRTAVGAKSNHRVRIGALWFDSLTFDQALEQISGLIEAGNGGSVFTPNTDHVVNAEQDPELREAYAAASLALVDGKPLVWASHLLGAPLPERIAGADFVLPLMKRAAQRRWKVYLLGARPGVGERAAEVLRQRYGVEIVGTDAPRLSRSPGAEEARSIERVCAARPNLVLVALGSPKQELWIHRAVESIRPAVAIAVGAVLDFIAGRVRRAPGWVARAGLEWLFRISQQPQLARRYLIRDPKFLFILLRTMRTPRGDRIRAPLRSD